MMEFYLILVFLFGISLGGYLTLRISKLNQEFLQKKEQKEITKVFKEILDNICSGQSRFQKRLNGLVFISTFLYEKGPVDVILNDSGHINIFKGDDCIYTSNLIDEKLRKQIINVILANYHSEINDVVELSGFSISKNIYNQWENELSKNLSIKIDKLKRDIEQQTSQSDIDKIRDENQDRLDIDEILDKINKFGVKSLTKREREFLDNFSK